MSRYPQDLRCTVRHSPSQHWGEPLLLDRRAEIMGWANAGVRSRSELPEYVGGSPIRDWPGYTLVFAVARPHVGFVRVHPERPLPDRAHLCPPADVLRSHRPW